MAPGRRADRRPLILIADDIVDNRQMYAEYLDYAGYRVEQARTGAEAIRIAQAVNPALIIMDLSMPDMDGWDATRRLKTDERTKAIPILVLTGHALGDAQQRAVAAGADAFITKPCLPDRLTAKIAAMLAGAAEQR
jgi:two-component system, cell cycle response regulator DivK